MTPVTFIGYAGLGGFSDLRHRLPLQSSSASRFAAGAAGFLILSQ